MTERGAGYLHGTSRAEQARLSRLNLSLNDLSLRELALAPGERVLDFGCGLGQLTRAMARDTAPGGAVVGIDASREQLDRALALATAEGEADLVDLRLGSVEAPPYRPGERGSFDVAHARFVLEHVADPLRVVREMVAAVRPGGRIAIQDDDHAALRLWPEPAGFLALWETYILVTARNQNDPFVGRRLPALLSAAGATPTRITGLFYGGAGGTAELASATENVIGLFEGVRDRLLLLSALSAAEFDATLAHFRAWSARPDAAMWYVFHWAEGRRPPD